MEFAVGADATPTAGMSLICSRRRLRIGSLLLSRDSPGFAVVARAVSIAMRLTSAAFSPPAPRFRSGSGHSDSGARGRARLHHLDGFRPVCAARIAPQADDGAGARAVKPAAPEAASETAQEKSRRARREREVFDRRAAHRGPSRIRILVLTGVAVIGELFPAM
jgi:hypothetical protein